MGKKDHNVLAQREKKKKETDESTSLARYCRKGKRTTKHGQPLLRHTHTHMHLHTQSIAASLSLTLSFPPLFFFFLLLLFFPLTHWK